MLPYVLLILLVLVPYWKLTTMQGVVITDDIFTSDLMNDGFPYRFYLGQALKAGEFPLWYPPVYGGFPLVARAESGVCFPPAILFFGLLPPYPALNFLILFTLVTAGIGMFLFARVITGSTAGALVAGVSFSWSGFMVSHLKHLSMIGTVSLFPLGLLALERAATAGADTRRRTRSLLAFSLLFGLQNLAGHIQTAYYAAIVYLFYYFLRLGQQRRAAARKGRRESPTGWWRALVGGVKSREGAAFAVALILGAGLSAIQLLPTYELVQQGERAEGVSFTYAADFAYNPANIVTFAVPYANGDASDGTYRGKSVFWEDYGYAGAFTLLLAVVALFSARREWHMRFFALAAIGAYLVVLGPATPLYEAVFQIVPGMKFFRFPTRFLFVVDAAIAILGAFGAERLLRARFSGLPGIAVRLLPGVVVSLVSADLLFVQLRQNPIVAMNTWAEPPATASILRQDPNLFRIYTPGSSDAHKEAFALARGWSGDLSPYVRQREFLQPSSNVLYGIASADGYAQLTPNHVVDIWGDQNRAGLIYRTASAQGGVFRPSPAFMKIMNISNVKYILSAWPMAGDFVESLDTVGGVFLFRNPAALPRAYLVERYRKASSARSAWSMLVSDGFDPAAETILYADPPLAPSLQDGPSRVTVTRYRSNEVLMETSSPGERLLVLADTDYPGWKAEVDGSETAIFRANMTQRAVVVPAGEHRVRFVFTPLSVWWGGALTLASFCCVLAGWAIAGRRAGT